MILRMTVGTLAWTCGILLLAGAVIGQDLPPAQPSAGPGTTEQPVNEDPASDPVDKPTAKPTAKPAANPAEAKPAGEPSKTPAGLIRLAKDYDLWIDPKRKLVVVDGRVCLREGQLEMFACPKGTKEHESVVALNCKSQFVHAALLAVGAQVGQTVRFNPEYVSASGTEVDVYVLWKDREGNNRQARAQEWVRHVPTKKAMNFPWVFAGSGFWTDEQTGERLYNADAGELICVSNFTTATLDLPVKSSQDNADLLFEAFTERIPAIGTQVRLVLRPKLPANPEAKPPAAPATPDAKPPAEPDTDATPAKPGTP